MDTNRNSLQRVLELEPAGRISLSGSVADQLAELIISERFGAGERLPPERELATRLRVSRIVVREALRTLAERGLIEVRPGVGAFVAPVTSETVTKPLSLYLVRNKVALAHLFELRHALEPRIAAAAALAATPEELKALGESIARSERVAAELEAELAANDAAAEESVEVFAWLDLEFHQLLAAASGNPLFQLVLEPLIDRQLAVRRDGARMQGNALRALRGHAAVLEALEQRDPDGAAAAMNAHLSAVESWLSEGSAGA